ncbi:hypothetical protein [Spirosoma luteum]|uniref:hypothetical protein n=1 Tax=Spirosoma luteum TaxID=431553 RepID=UPI000367660B|nr:hypothetical protein [Spirosoma luteum]
MPQTTFTLTKREGDRTLRAETEADLSKDDLAALLDELKAHGSPEFGEFATIYVAPDEYTLHVKDQSIPLKPQFFPTRYSHIINELTSKLA